MNIINGRPRNRESRTRRSRSDEVVDGMVTVSFRMPQEEWYLVLEMMRNRDVTEAEIFYAGLDKYLGP